MVTTDGSSHIQSDEYNGPLSSDDNSSITIDKTFSNKLYQSQKEQNQRSKFEISNEGKEVSGPISEQSLDKDILSFVFPLDLRYLQSHLDSAKSNADDKVWFNGIVDLKTGNVISAKLGRLLNPQQRPQQYSDSTGHHRQR